MAHPTLEYIRGLRKSLETKKAEIVGENPPSSMPGSEHDSKPDESAKEPDKETKDETMVPNSGLTTSGAGDDSKITHTNDLVAGESALTPTKKPMVTGDADAKTAEQLAAEILSGVDAWYAKKAEADKAASKPVEAKKAENEAPSAGEGTAEALITDNGKTPDQIKDDGVKEPNKKDEISADAMVPATGEGSVGETAEHAKKAGALDMELTSDVLAKIAAVMLATEEGTKLAESTLAKAAGAEAAEKTLSFLKEQNGLAQKQAEYRAGRRDALELLRKSAEGEDVAEGGDEVEEIANALDEMVDSGELTEDEADQVVVEIAQALEGDGGEGGDAEAAAPEGCENGECEGGEGEELEEIANALGDMVDAGEITEEEANQLADEIVAAAQEGGEGDADAEVKKEAQAVDPTTEATPPAEDPAAAGNAAIDQAVAVDPAKLDPNSVPQGDMQDISPDDVADAIDTLVQSGEITDDEADGLVQEITGAEGGEAPAEGDVSPEEIATALQDAVESGELKPEDVQQVLTELEGVPAPGAEGQTADAAAAADATDAAQEASPTATPAQEGAEAPAEPKTAAAAILDQIKAARR